jgi:uncharacterized protein involved in exopolysaccharide biosynthesis
MAVMSDPSADREPRAAPPHDEISLRELYLVLRRRAGWIVAAALVAGVAAFAAVAVRPPVYVAEATAVVARAPIEVGLGTGIRFRPEVDVTYDTYQTFAFTRSVLEEVLPFHDARDLSRLREALTLERVAGAATPTQTSGLLAVAHRARSTDAATAAAAASAWAAATVATARRLLLENLDAVEAITGDGLDAARRELEAAEADLEDYRAASGVDALRARLGMPGTGAAGTLDLAIGDVEAALRANRLAVSQRLGELGSLRERRDAGGGGLEVVLNATPEVALSIDGAIASVEAQLAGLLAEQEALVESLADLRRQRDADAATLAEAAAGVARRERAVAVPREIVASLAAIEPSVAFVAQVAPSGARVLSEAVVPSAPEPRRLAVLALLAAVVAAFAAVVVTLLAEAVRDPRLMGTAAVRNGVRAARR